MSGYATVARTAEVETEVERSRFLARVERVGTEADARAVVERARREHRDARHHCSAFVLGPASPDGEVQRAADDGEPAGTAGAPMLEVLRGEAVADVVAVVTRWFGGVLLGTGGLVRAYAEATRAALAEAGRVRRTPMERFDLDAGHADAARWEAELRARQVTVLGADYAERVRLHLAVPAADADGFADLVAAVTAGVATPAPAGRVWVDRPWDGGGPPG